MLTLVSLSLLLLVSIFNATSASATSVTLSVSGTTNACPNGSTGQDADICLTVPVDGGVATGSHAVTADYTGPKLGYNVTMSSATGDANMNLASTDKDNQIKPVGAPGALGDNQWGYALGAVNDATNNTWLPVPSSNPSAIISKTADDASTTEQIVTYGVKVGGELKEGGYSATVKYTATLQLPPAPIITSVSPNSCTELEIWSWSGGDHSDCLITIEGQNLSNLSRIYLWKDFSSDDVYDRYICSNITIASDSKVTCYVWDNAPITQDSYDHPWGSKPVAIYAQDVYGQTGVLDNAFTYRQLIKGCISGHPYSSCVVDIDPNMIPVMYGGVLGTSGAPWYLMDNYLEDGFGYDYYSRNWLNAVTMRDDFNGNYYCYADDKLSGEMINVTANTVPDDVRLGIGFMDCGEADGMSGYRLTPLAAQKLRLKLIMKAASDGTVEQCEYGGGSGVYMVGIDCISPDYGGDLNVPTPAAYISEEDILGYWVYIPRFEYKIMTDSGSNLVQPSTFNIQFQDKTEKSTGTKAGEWATHPAFSWCDSNGKCEELNGFWIGKFETTGSTKAPTILPNQHHKSYEPIGVFYDIAKSIGVKDNANTYGNGTEASQNTHNLKTTKSHMLKNSEWGAVAYLSASLYGAGVDKVQLNSSSDEGTDDDGLSSPSLTGCGPKANGDVSNYNCADLTDNQWQGGAGQLASTTNNTYGVYDMSGGAWEDVMGSLSDDMTHSSTQDGYVTTAIQPPYVDLYAASVFDGNWDTNMTKCTWLTCGGDATYETYEWGNKWASFVRQDAQWFYRGGYYISVDETGAATAMNIFSSGGIKGPASRHYGFRTALLAN